MHVIHYMYINNAYSVKNVNNVQYTSTGTDHTQSFNKIIKIVSNS